MRNLLFSVGRLEYAGGGMILVGGRCCGDPIRSGDEAQFIVPKEQFGQPEEPQPILLRFPDFQSYGCIVHELDSGHTAGILVPGDVGERLRLGSFIKGSNP